MVRFTAPALVDGSVGLVWAPRGRLLRALKLGFANGRIARVEIVADPEHLRELELGVLSSSSAR
ncbi:MAG TPA: hypothetical protein VGZ29_16600 [Terriglobia bacterium]|nr:hypothetical protein [Terriglobia bacterium]